MTDIEYITDAAQLQALCHRIQPLQWLALDTEFMREKTYYPEFCLLQLATPEWVACVDPKAGYDLAPLWTQLLRTDLVKVIHSCRQDLEIFYHLTGQIPGPVFDTQIAAPLLGLPENAGYALLVSHFLNVNLSKAHSRTDWLARPLSPEQLRYAADDVTYLCLVYQKMLTKLNELGRMNWLAREFADLMDVKLYEVQPTEAWRRIRGKFKLTGRQLGVLKVLAQWREETAKSQNKPRSWLLRDELMVELAKLQPTTVEALSKVRQINDGLVRKQGEKLCQLIAEALTRPAKMAEEKGKTPRLNAQQEAVLDLLTAWVKVKAAQNSLNPVSLAGRKDLEALLLEPENSALNKGWRHAMVGQDLEALLAGTARLQIQDHKVCALTDEGQPLNG
ncbi:MAG: ribonuclease D [Methylococcales bacterium]|nr:ribonuclease D [Methylococcales bacterium]